MADLAGRLDIELKRSDGGAEATIRSSRPIAASRVFVGTTVEEARTGLPALFSICNTAQACAFANACEAALGLVPSPDVIRLRHFLVDLETVKEHLWRMLLDWPRFLGEPPRLNAMRAVMAAYSGLRAQITSAVDPFCPGADALVSDFRTATAFLDELARLSAEHILRASPAVWLHTIQTPEDLLAWAGNTDSDAAGLVCEVQARHWQAVGRNPVSSLPPLSVAELEALFACADADRLLRAPSWQGDPRESSPFTRQRGREPVNAMTEEYGNGLLPRLVAQLVELASAQTTLRTGFDQRGSPSETSAASTGAGIGIARVRAARGLLVHRVVVHRGRIGDYRILAPTEWNFHPRGVVARGLSALPVADAATLERLAGLLVTAVDPCVEYHVAVC